LEHALSTTNVLGTLYLVSELGDQDMILDMVSEGNAHAVIVPEGSLDEDVVKVIKSRARFRTALSEHLAFWTRLGTATQSSQDHPRFACSLPNVQPEDKGPDGLFLSTGAVSSVEIQSVKNSIGNPQSLLSTRQFRTRGTPSTNKGKLLEDFHRFAHQNFGFIRLERLLFGLCKLLDLHSTKKIRMALLSDTECSYNAVIVADHQYAEAELFQGYQYITSDARRRIATYVGSTKWAQVAEQTRQYVFRNLEQLGLV